MKYKIISILCIILMVLLPMGVRMLGLPQNRYHQHLQAQEKPKCTTHGKETFCTHIPLINITTKETVPAPFLYNEDGSRTLNNKMVQASVQYFDNQEYNNHLTDTPTVSEHALIRTRGRSSRGFDKQGYLLKFMEADFLNNKKVSLSGMTADSDWVLHGPFLDKTLIRNYLCYNLAGEIMDYSPNVRFCEIFINGTYKGLYLLTEKIEYNDEGRIKFTETDPDLPATSYIVKLDEEGENPLYSLNTFSEYSGKNGPRKRGSNKLEIIYPNKTLTLEQKEYIEAEISRFEKALVSFDSADKNYGYPSFIDTASFVDYFIINEFTMNSDAARLSTFFYKDIRGKLKITVWDFNSAFDNYLPVMSEPHYFMMTDKFWYEYMLRDQDFSNKIIYRYNALRKTYLSDEYLVEYIDETIAYLGDAIDRNYEVWGYSFSQEEDMLIPTERNPRNFEEAVADLKQSIIKRGEFLDANIETLKSLSHDSINKQFNHDVGGRS